MRKILSCEFNLDTACVELHLEDGTLLSIDCTAVENEVANGMYQRSELDWMTARALTRPYNTARPAPTAAAATRGCSRVTRSISSKLRRADNST